MINFEVALLTILSVAVVAAWYFAIVRLKPTDTKGADQFPVSEGEEIDAHVLGQIEGSLKGLIKVIVAAHRVEEPQNALRVAVKKNLVRNVEYLFLVSKSRSVNERDGWINMFVAIAKVVLAEAGSQLKPRDLIHISHLAHEWKDTPYVFYQTETSSGQMSVVAFRGNQVGEGIAEKYTRLPSHLAYTIANAILSDAPKPMEIVEEPFMVEPDIDLSASRREQPPEERHEQSV